MPNPRPNFLFLVADQLRADHLGCYGNPDIETPHIDRLAREGICLTESYVANPICMPNRASLFTGRYPKAHALRENGITLPLTESVLPEILRQTGYRTASFGKIHLAPFLADHNPDHRALDHERYEDRNYWASHDTLPSPYYGFEHVYFVGGHGNYVFGHYKQELDRDHPGMYQRLQIDAALVSPSGAVESWKAAIPEELHYNTRIADKTIDYLKSSDRNQPFFIWCSFPDPHHPYSPPRPYCDQYDPKKIAFSPTRRANEFDDLPPFVRECYDGRRMVGWRHDLSQITDDQLREIVAHTYGMISMVDHNVGRIMRTLEETGLLEDTVVVFLSDHGDLMGDHWLIQKGPFLYRSLVRVPLIWRLPRMPNPDVSSAALVSAVDVCPTVLDLAGVAPPSAGRVALDDINWVDIPLREGMQGRSFKRVLHGDQTAFREWVYIEYDTSNLGDRLRQLRSQDWALTYYTENPYGMLFDLRDDPDELHNRWDDERYAETKRDLLITLLRETARADDWLPTRKALA